MAVPSNYVAVQGQGSIGGDQFNTLVQTCDTAADLRGFIGQNNMMVALQGITAPGDGNAGLFRWNSSSTAADNNSTIIAPTGVSSGRWVLCGLQVPSTPISGLSYSFATTAALLTAFPNGVTLPDGSIAFTAGRTAEGDTGGAEFFYNKTDTTSADNGGTIRVDGAGRRWYAIVDMLTPQLFGGLAAAVTGLGSQYVQLWISSGQAISTNLTIPSNIDLYFLPNSSLSPLAGVTVTVLGNVISRARGIFNLSNGGAVSFAGNFVMSNYVAEWWALPFGSPSVDASILLNAMVNAVPDYCTITFSFNAGTLYLQNPWQITGRTGLTIQTSLNIEELPQVTLQANGQAGGTGIVQMQSCGHCTLQGFQINCYFVGVKIYGDGPPRISTNNSIIHNRINNLTGFSFIGIQIAPSEESNNEFMQIIGNYIAGNGSASAGLGTGIYTGSSSENHGHLLQRNTITGCQYAITADWAGFKIEQGNFTSNQIDILISHIAYPIEIDHCDSETSQQFFVSGGLAGNVGGESSVAINSCRLAGLGATGVAWIEIGTGSSVTTIQGVDFQNYPNNNSYLISIPWDAGVFPGQCVNLIGDYEGNAIDQGIPGGNVLVRSGSFPPQIVFPVNIIGEAITGGLQHTWQVGNTLTVSGNTINVTNDAHFVTGPATLETIVLPTPLQYAPNIASTRALRLTVIAVTGTITVSTGGNIAAATSIAAGQAMDFLYMGSTGVWYPMV